MNRAASNQFERRAGNRGLPLLVLAVSALFSVLFGLGCQSVNHNSTTLTQPQPVPPARPHQITACRPVGRVVEHQHYQTQRRYENGDGRGLVAGSDSENSASTAIVVAYSHREVGRRQRAASPIVPASVFTRPQNAGPDGYPPPLTASALNPPAGAVASEINVVPGLAGRAPQDCCAPSTARRTLSRWGNTIENDFESFLERLGDDTIGLANTHNAAVLGFALAASLGVRHGFDEDVRDNTRRHPSRWGETSRGIGRLGEAQYQVAALGLLYGYTRFSDDRRFDGVTRSLFSAATITGLTTLSIKAIANTDRPSDNWNGGQFGFPSYHSSSTFAAAAVLDEYYGARVGIPAYLVAGLVGWTRIDERDHDLSDVVFGAALGYVIGKSVAGRHLRGDGRVRILPFMHPEGGSGLMLDIAF